MMCVDSGGKKWRIKVKDIFASDVNKSYRENDCLIREGLAV
jgi:hypothetical protein